MKVRIEMTVEVDAETWTSTYGVEGAAQVRADVKDYVEGLVPDSAAGQECDLRVIS